MSLITNHEFNATNPVQMRQEILKLARDNPLVSACSKLATYHGLSERDFLTMLAYSALDALQQTQLNYLAELILNPKPIVVEKAS